MEDTSSDTDLSREERLELEEKGFVVDHPDNDAIQRVAVDDWDDVVARITGPADHFEGDGVDISMDTLAGEQGVVELLVKGEVVLRLVHVEDAA